MNLSCGESCALYICVTLRFFLSSISRIPLFSSRKMLIVIEYWTILTIGLHTWGVIRYFFIFLVLEVCFSTPTPIAPLKLLIVVVELSHCGQTLCACPPVNRNMAPERAVIVFEHLTFMMISFRLVITRDVCVSQLIGAVTWFLILRSVNVFFYANSPITPGKKGAVFSVASNCRLIARVISECLQGLLLLLQPSKRSISG